MSQTDVVFLSGARTPIGSFGGALKDVPPTALGAHAAKAAIARAGVAPEDIGHTVFGHVIHTEPRDMRMAKVKSPAESKGPWDYFTIGEIIPAEQAFRPADQSACPLLKT
ncbi:thiolase family protein [Xanthobacter autotrophicus]|uniref:thiolase family protein n=1 Tax=Xanthobacter autotrophicus TaxID=280 RepID=UPI003727BF45